MSKIFFSLNAVDLPEYFEDHMSEWMTLLHTLLTFESSLEAVVGDEDDEKAGLLHKVKSQVCRIINLYTSKYEEEFTPYFITFLHDIWSLLERTNLQPRYDSLAVSAMQFLSTLASGVQHTQFKESGTLRTICEKIVIPNLQLRDVELENFADNPVEYIRRDIEGGGDNDTRRNASTQLIKSLRKYFEVETTQICQAYITELLKTYTANPQKNWLSKDVSIYLVTALAVRSTLASQGATNVNELVPVMQFFETQILPELQTETPAHPILKADALKFIWTFRQQLPKTMYTALMPLIVNNLKSKNYVVYTYAAACLERLLCVKEKTPQGLVPRFGKEDLAPFVNVLLPALFQALEAEQSKENEYLMKVVMRVCGTMQEGIVPIGKDCVNALIQVFSRIYRNPVNAVFNHYLFEALAVLTRIMTKASAEGKVQLESQMFPIFNAILSEDIIEFEPYVFQILAILIESNTSDIPASYFQLLPPLLTPLLWGRSGNIPPLVRLIVAYIQKGGAQVVAQNQVRVMLGIVQSSLLNTKYDDQAFNILSAVVTYLPQEAWAPFLKDILINVLNYFSQSKLPRGRVSFLLFSSKLISKCGLGTYAAVLESVQPGMLMIILDKIWIAFMRYATTVVDRKMLAVTTTSLLLEPQIIAVPTVWKALIEAELSLLEHETSQADGDEDEESDTTPELGGAHYTPLVYASKHETDPLPDVNPRTHLASSYTTCSPKHQNKCKL